MTLGEKGYNIYKLYANNTAFDGSELPEWEHVSEIAKTIWENTLKVVISSDERDLLKNTGRTDRMCEAAKSDKNINLNTLEIYGVNITSKIFFDHYVLELKYNKVLEKLHEFEK